MGAMPGRRLRLLSACVLRYQVVSALLSTQDSTGTLSLPPWIRTKQVPLLSLSLPLHHPLSTRPPHSPASTVQSRATSVSQRSSPMTWTSPSSPPAAAEVSVVPSPSTAAAVDGGVLCDWNERAEEPPISTYTITKIDTITH